MTGAIKARGILSKEVKYKKPPCAPKRFKSAYMFFSERKHKEFRRREECKKMRTADVAKLVSQAWKSLASSERLVFLDMAKKDKERYEVEKANYKGPWKVVEVKDRSAPKRPMSAFLAFSNARRKEVTEKNPLMTNGDISKVLANMWRDAPTDQKQMYQNEEIKLREQYKAKVSKRSSKSTKHTGTSLPVLDCASLSSASQKNSPHPIADDENQILHLMLDSLDDASADGLSNSSRTYSVSDNTARVTLTDEHDYSMSVDASFEVDYLLPAPKPPTASPSLYIMEQPKFGSPYPLNPLIPTDFGGFLAAAAMLDGSSDPFL